MKHLRKVYTGILILLPSLVFGTAQVPDYLIYDGDTLAMYTNPLESYFDMQTRPDNIFDKYGYRHTGCWRGYVAYWELRNDSLFLVSMQGDPEPIDISLVFKDKKENEAVFAHWFTGSVLNPYGDRVLYVHMGYESFYQFEREFEFTEGLLNGILHFDNSKSKISRYSSDWELLDSFIQDNLDISVLPDTVTSLKVYVQIDSVNSNGKIANAIVLRGQDKTIDKEALRVVFLIPKWNAIYSKGELTQPNTIIPIIFNKE